MMSSYSIPKRSIILSPMEGVTDDIYRVAMEELGLEWDFMACDFYRVPRFGRVSEKTIIEHFGKLSFANEKIKQKTIYQILTSPGCQTEEVVKVIDGLDFNHLDLNLGCPSKKVNAHQGGAYLLSNLPELLKIIKIIRQTFSRTFSVKIRVGYMDDSLFTELLKMFNGEGIDYITIHARTKLQMYKGIANWDYIREAVGLSTIPIIGNGDIWTLTDIDEMFEYTGCHSVMCARGAMKTPWLPYLYKKFPDHRQEIDNKPKFLNHTRVQHIHKYFDLLHNKCVQADIVEKNILSRFKSLSRYLFDDLPQGDKIRGTILRSQDLTELQSNLGRLRT